MTSQKYKFFINAKPVILCENPGLVDEVLDYPHPFIIQQYKSTAQVDRLIEILHEPENESGLVLFMENLDVLFDKFCSHFTCIEAAGGVVQNDCGEVLLIFRRGCWDLPKGKLDAGETVEQAAVREVEEETGLKGVRLLSKIFFPEWLNEATYHSYLYQGKIALKISHWYLMNYVGNGELIPQTEEDITEARWVPVSQLHEYRSEMYPNISDVLDAVFSH